MSVKECMTKTKEIKTREQLVAQISEALLDGSASDELVESAANYVLWNLLREKINVTRIKGGYNHGDFEVETF